MLRGRCDGSCSRGILQATQRKVRHKTNKFRKMEHFDGRTLKRNSSYVELQSRECRNVLHEFRSERRVVACVEIIGR